MGKRAKALRKEQELQRALSGDVVESKPVLAFQGESFEVAAKLGLMPLLAFAHVAKQGVDANDMKGLVAIYDLLRNVLADDEWDRFTELATATRADGDELMEVVSQAIELISSRPTGRSSDSSAGPEKTKDSSADDLSLRVIRRLEHEGRPSIALMVKRRMEAEHQAHASQATG